MAQRLWKEGHHHRGRNPNGAGFSVFIIFWTLLKRSAVAYKPSDGGFNHGVPKGTFDFGIDEVIASQVQSLSPGGRVQSSCGHDNWGAQLDRGSHPPQHFLLI